MKVEIGVIFKLKMEKIVAIIQDDPYLVWEAGTFAVGTNFGGEVMYFWSDDDYEPIPKEDFDDERIEGYFHIAG